MRRILQWQKRFSLRATLLIGFGLVLSFALVMAVVTFIQVQTLSTSFDQLDQIRNRTDTLNQIRLDSSSYVAAALDQIWSGRLISLINDSVTKTRQGFDELNRTDPDPALTQDLKKLQAKSEELFKFVQKTIELDAAGQTQEAHSGWVQGSILFQDFNQDISRLVQVEETSLQQTTRQVTDTRNSAFIIIAACMMLSLLAATLLGVFITNSIVRRAKLISAAMQEVTEGRDLAATQLQVEGKDELATMSQAFNHMIKKLSAALHALETTGQTVSSSSEHFGEMMQRQVSAAAQEAQAVGLIASAANELSQTARGIDERAETMAAQARDNLNNLNLISKVILLASEQAFKTHEVTRTASAGVSRMFAEIGSVGSEVQELVTQLSAIRRIAHDLKEIAKNTHLLSLNAAIESASAGEHGERFRVVAIEVKNLADQSQKLVDNMRFFMQAIANRVENVTTAISKTDQELTKNQELIEIVEQIGQEGKLRADELVEAVNEISLLVNETVNQTEMIALASREQRIATEQIISTIQGVDDAVNENMQHYQTSTREVTKLNTEVRLLNTLVTDLSGTGKVA